MYYYSIVWLPKVIKGIILLQGRLTLFLRRAFSSLKLSLKQILTLKNASQAMVFTRWCMKERQRTKIHVFLFQVPCVEGSDKYCWYFSTFPSDFPPYIIRLSSSFFLTISHLVCQLWKYPQVHPIPIDRSALGVPMSRWTRWKGLLFSHIGDRRYDW